MRRRLRAAAVLVLSGALSGGMIGYTAALIAVDRERNTRLEGHATDDAAMQVVCAQGVAWAEAWKALAVDATDARLGLTP